MSPCALALVLCGAVTLLCSHSSACPCYHHSTLECLIVSHVSLCPASAPCRVCPLCSSCVSLPPSRASCRRLRLLCCLCSPVLLLSAINSVRIANRFYFLIFLKIFSRFVSRLYTPLCFLGDFFSIFHSLSSFQSVYASSFSSIMRSMRPLFSSISIALLYLLLHWLRDIGMLS